MMSPIAEDIDKGDFSCVMLSLNVSMIGSYSFNCQIID